MSPISLPLQHSPSETSVRLVHELLDDSTEGPLDASVGAPYGAYRRSDVWDFDQQQLLVQSWLLGVPVPGIVVNDRRSADWQVNWGARPAAPPRGVVDGVQRLSAGWAWLQGNLGVPCDWFDASEVARTRELYDGTPVVTLTGLTAAAQERVRALLLLPVTTVRLPSLAAEAEMSVVLNELGAGVPLGGADLQRALDVAARG